MAQEIALDITINSLEASKSLAELKKSIKDATNTLATFEEGSAEFNKLSGAIGKAKDNVQDLNEAVALSSQGGFGAIADIGSKIAAGFSVAQSAMALFGSESKELEETLMKVQAAMALAQGAKELSELGKSFNNLKTVAGGALKSIKAEIAATGIGLLVIALGTIVAYWDDIKAAVSGVSEEQKKLLETTTEIEKNAAAQLDKIERTEETLKLQGKTEKEIFEAKVKAANVDLEAGLNKLKVQKQIAEAEIAAAKRNEEIAKVAIQVLLAPITLILTQIDLVGKAFGKNFGLREGMAKSVAGMLGFSSEETRKEAKKTIDEQQKAIDELTNKRDGWINAQNEKEKQAKENASKKAEEERKKQLELETELNKLIAGLRVENIEDARREAFQKLKLDYETQRKEYEIKFKGKEKLQQLLTELDTKFRDDNVALQDKFNKEDEAIAEEKRKKQLELEAKIRDQKLKALEADIAQEKIHNVKKGELTIEQEVTFENKRYEILKSNKELNNDELRKLEADHLLKISELADKQRKEQEEKEKQALERRQRNIQFGIDSTVQGLQTLQSLVTAFAGKSEAQQKKAFEVNKAAQIAETIISTISGAQKAYTSQLIPGDPTSPIRGAIAAALTIAGGIARVRQIEQTKFESKSSSSMSSGGGGGGEFAPNLNAPVSNTSTNLSSIGFGGQESEPVKVFVTETDISSTQNKVQKIEQKASIE